MTNHLCNQDYIMDYVMVPSLECGRGKNIKMDNINNNHNNNINNNCNSKNTPFKGGPNQRETDGGVRK